jgi:hypothetical protein
VIKLAGVTQNLPQDKESWPTQTPARNLLQHHFIPKQDNSFVNNWELAVQENLTIAKVSIQK